ncbi:MAG TPA: hypothetical protein VIJ43_05115 [Burkholderiales bacterium]
METVLLSVIVLLLVAICALGGFWFYRAAQASKRSAKPPQPARHAPKHDRWEGAVRASRDKI